DEVASFVERIRASEQFVPELALVAEDITGVIAHVLLSWVGVDGGSRTRILNLTPMSVRPDRQRIGVGARLIRDALGRAEEAGEPAVMVEGLPRSSINIALTTVRTPMPPDQRAGWTRTSGRATSACSSSKTMGGSSVLRSRWKFRVR